MPFRLGMTWPLAAVVESPPPPQPAMASAASVVRAADEPRPAGHRYLARSLYRWRYPQKPRPGHQTATVGRQSARTSRLAARCGGGGQRARASNATSTSRLLLWPCRTFRRPRTPCVGDAQPGQTPSWATLSFRLISAQASTTRRSWSRTPNGSLTSFENAQVSGPGPMAVARICRGHPAAVGDRA